MIQSIILFGKTYLLRELRVRIKRIWVPIIVGLLLLMLLLPQTAVSDVPGLSNVQVPNITETTATITWTTNTSLPSKVYYGTDKPPVTYVEDSTPVTNHYMILDSLDPATVYYFYVQSGNLTDNNDGLYYSFETLAVPGGYYSLTLEPACGVCGELIKDGICGEVIGVTAIVSAPGTYYICWDTAAEASAVATFAVLGAGSRSLTFHAPEAKKGPHTVYLTDSAFAEKASAIFTVNPSVKIDLDQGPVGTNVTLNGYGFNASQQIQVKFNDTVVSSATTPPTADSKGSWEFSYTIPPTPGGGYTFDIGPKSDPNVILLSKSFTVTPAITVTDANPDDGIYSGTVGQKIEINGTGFKSKEEGIKITFGGEPVNLSSPVVADENGSWHALIAVPPLQRGTYAIGASGELTRARNVPPVDFIVGAGILVEPISAYIGDNITVAGGGFAPGETGIQVYFDELVVSPTTITADIHGAWESSFTLPVSTYGSHTVSASGDITQPAVTRAINTQAEILAVSPAEGAPGDSVSLTGNGFHGSQKLTVTIGGVAASGDMSTQYNGNVVISFRVPQGSTEGSQTLVVNDQDGATASADFTVTKKTLSIIPLPVSPQDSTLRSGEVTFHWVASVSDSTYSYSLEVSQTKDGLPFRSALGIKENSYTLTNTQTQNVTLPKGTYYWRVKIVDDYGNEGAWSDSIKFTVAPIPTWVWVVVGLVVLVVLMVVAYRETKFRVTE
jgi:hypothetical protein